MRIGAQGRLLAWLIEVPDAERAEFERLAARAAPVSNDSSAPSNGALGIWDYNASGVPVRAPRADKYVVAWSHVPNVARFKDMYGTAERAAALETAARTGRPVLSNVVPYTFVDAPGADMPSSMVRSGGVACAP